MVEDPTVSTAWAVLTLLLAEQGIEWEKPAPMELAARFQPRRALVLGRIHHGGDWDVFPQATEQLSLALAGAVSVGLVQEDVFEGQVFDPSLTLVHLTGSRLEGFGAPARQALKAYLDRGGILLVDSAVGHKEFFEQAKKMLEGLFGQGALKPIPANDPLITGEFAGGIGNDLREVRYSPAAAARLGKPAGPPQLWAVRSDGQPVAVVSHLGITAPAGGDPPERYVGYVPEDARRIALNLLLYAYALQRQAN
jgi:hypothetical protein